MPLQAGFIIAPQDILQLGPEAMQGVFTLTATMATG